MLKAHWKHSITYLFLAVFTLMRVANLHTVKHVLADAEYEHCELCELITTTNQSTPLQTTITQAATPFASFLDTRQGEIPTNYTVPEQKTLLSDYFYNKPPPNPFVG